MVTVDVMTRMLLVGIELHGDAQSGVLAFLADGGARCVAVALCDERGTWSVGAYRDTNGNPASDLRMLAEGVEADAAIDAVLQEFGA